jgi:hypothetical protein
LLKKSMSVDLGATETGWSGGSWVVFSHDGHRALSTHHVQQTVILWDVDAGRELGRSVCDRRVNKAVVSPDGSYAACGTYRGSIEIFALLPDGPKGP